MINDDNLIAVLNKTSVAMIDCINIHISSLNADERFKFAIEITAWFLAYTADRLISNKSPSAIKYELIDDIKDIAKSLLEEFIERREKMAIKQEE